LEDVNSGETFTVAELEKPVLVETFAVWCPTCTNQQREIREFHEQSNTTSVSLNVDSNEDEEQITRHTEENGFDWRYAVSPPELTRILVNEYGTTIANPPSAPAILVCENGTRRLPNGVKPVSKLQEEVEKGC
jgi:peroxiredoxin